MPAKPSKSSGPTYKKESTKWIPKSKQKKGGSWFGTQISDIAQIASGAPASIWTLGTSMAAAKPKRFGGKGDTRPLKAIGKAQVDSIKALADPNEWRSHTARNLIGVLGLAPIPGAAAGKLATVSKVARGKPRTKKRPTRTLEYKPRSVEEGDFYKKQLDLKGRPKVLRTEIPASRNPVMRTAQRGGDKLRKKSDTLQRRKVERGIAEDIDIRARLNEASPQGIIQALAQVGTNNPVGFLQGRGLKRGAMDVTRELNALGRGARLYRAAYVPPNKVGAEAASLLHQGPVSYIKNKRIPMRERMRDPHTMEAKDRLMGDTISEAMFDTGAQGPISTVMRGVGQTLSKVTDRPARNQIWDKSAENFGYSKKDIPALIRAAENGNPKALRDVVSITKEAERAAIKFTRASPFPGRKTSPIGEVDKALADNIFLYKWLTASGRYGGRTMSEHPTLTQALSAQEHFGESQPTLGDMYGELAPDFMQNYMASGENESGDPTFRSTQAASLWDFPFDFAERAKKGFTQGPEVLSDVLNPVQAALANAVTGWYPFRNPNEPYVDTSELNALEQLLFGIKTQATSPWQEWGRADDTPETRERRLYPLTLKDIIGRQILSPMLWNTPYNPEVMERMARQQNEKLPAKKSKHKKRSSTRF